MTTPSPPDLLFRTCSDTSAGRLNSGKKNHVTASQQQDLPEEFASHSNFWDHITPTALVSTTALLLHAIHIAFDKLYRGEEAERVEIIFIKLGSEAAVAASAKVHSAETLADGLQFSAEKRKNYKGEYLFEWEIPESLVVHLVTMATLLQRGFSIERLCGPGTAFVGFPRMREFRMEIRHYLRSLRVYNKGLQAGRVACLFGCQALAGRLAADLLSTTAPDEPSGRVGRGIAEAVKDYEFESGGSSDELGWEMQLSQQVVVW